MRTQQLAAGLYSQLDQFYMASSGRAANSAAAGSTTAGSAETVASHTRPSPLRGTAEGDYELATDGGGEYEMRSAVAATAAAAGAAYRTIRIRRRRPAAATAKLLQNVV